MPEPEDGRGIRLRRVENQGRLDSRAVVNARVAEDRENQAGGAPSRVNSAINWYKS